jgi:hypothetical protein
MSRTETSTKVAISNWAKDGTLECPETRLQQKAMPRNLRRYWPVSTIRREWHSEYYRNPVGLDGIDQDI